jgi:putative ABC transport system permease protein
MLARGMTRGRELAVRRALGASRYRIIRQALTETLILCILGALLGALLSRFGLDLLLRSLAGYLDPWRTFATDGRVLGFCVGVVGLATILSGLVPALHAASGRDTESTLRATTARSTASASGRRSLNVLVAGEIALAMTLSVGAVLLLEAFYKVSRVEPGFRVDGLLTYRISLPSEQYKDGSARQALFQSHLERVRTLPGVRTASFTNMGPGDGHNSTRFDVEGVERAPGEMNPTVLVQTVMKEDGRLFAQLTGQGQWEICPRARDEFFSNEVIAHITFVRDDQGKVSGGIHHQNGQTTNVPKLKEEAVATIDPMVALRYE